jgi:hypothetical protein
MAETQEERLWRDMFNNCACPGEEFGTCEHAAYAALRAEIQRPLLDAYDKALLEAAEAIQYAINHCDLWVVPALEKAHSSALDASTRIALHTEGSASDV